MGSRDQRQSYVGGGIVLLKSEGFGDGLSPARRGDKEAYSNAAKQKNISLSLGLLQWSGLVQ